MPNAKRKIANRFKINQLAFYVVDYYDKLSNLAFFGGLILLQSFIDNRERG